MILMAVVAGATFRRISVKVGLEVKLIPSSKNMSSQELQTAGAYLHGKEWRKALADQLGIDVATLRRYTNGGMSVPGPVALAVRLLVERQEITRDFEVLCEDAPRLR